MCTESKLRQTAAHEILPSHPHFTIELRTKGKTVKQNSTGPISFSGLLAFLSNESSPGLSLILVNKDIMLVQSYLTYINFSMEKLTAKQINLLEESDVLLLLC